MASGADSPKRSMSVGTVFVTDPTGFGASQRAARSIGVSDEPTIDGNVFVPSPRLSNPSSDECARWDSRTSGRFVYLFNGVAIPSSLIAVREGSRVGRISAAILR
jgi:hypothetical protein